MSNAPNTSLTDIPNQASPTEVRRVHHQIRASLLDRLVERKVRHTWLNNARAAALVQLQDLVHALAHVYRQRAADARSRAAVADVAADGDGGDGEGVPVGSPHDCLDIFYRAGVGGSGGDRVVLLEKGKGVVGGGVFHVPAA